MQQVRRRYDFIGNDAVRRDGDLAFAITWSFNGDRLDLTGQVLEFKVRKADDDVGAPVLILDNAGHGGITLADQVNPTTRGKASFLLPNASIIGTLSPGRWSYSARATSGGGITVMFFGYIDFEGPDS